jgi:hypothetical protein
MIGDFDYAGPKSRKRNPGIYDNFPISYSYSHLQLKIKFPVMHACFLFSVLC